MPPLEPAVWIAVITAVGALLGGGIAARSNQATKRLESTLAPYVALAARVVALEQADTEKAATIQALRVEVELLRRESALDRDYIARAAAWISTHEPGTYPPPMPPMWVRYSSETANATTTPEGHA